MKNLVEITAKEAEKIIEVDEEILDLKAIFWSFMSLGSGLSFLAYDVESFKTLAYITCGINLTSICFFLYNAFLCDRKEEFYENKNEYLKKYHHKCLADLGSLSLVDENEQKGSLALTEKYSGNLTLEEKIK